MRVCGHRVGRRGRPGHRQRRQRFDDDRWCRALRARAPKVRAALEASIGLAGPIACDGVVTLADYQIKELGEVMGLATADASGLSGTISGSVAFKGNLRDASSMTVTLNVSPVDAGVFDVPIALSRGLRAAMTGRPRRDRRMPR